MPEIITCNKDDDNLISIIASLAGEIWNEHYVPIIGQKQVDYMLENFQSKEVIKKQLQDGWLYYLLKSDDNYIGYTGLIAEEESLFLSKIYIKSEYRGKGYGKQLLTFIENLAKERGLNSISLTVNKNNLNSINSYQKWGFTIIKSLVQDIGNGYVMDDYKMQKTI